MMKEGMFAMATLMVLAVTIWGFLAWLLRPVYGRKTLTLFFVDGEGAGLEQQVRSFGWNRAGRSSGGELLLVDCGLDEQGLSTAQILMRERPWLSYCPEGCLEDYLELRRFQSRKAGDIQD